MCSTRLRVPEPAAPGEALPVARETSEALTPPRNAEAAPVARVVSPEAAPIGPPSTLEPPVEAASPPSELADQRRMFPALLTAGVGALLLAAGVALWIGKPWSDGQTSLPRSNPPAAPAPSGAATNRGTAPAAPHPAVDANLAAATSAPAPAREEAPAPPGKTPPAASVPPSPPAGEPPATAAAAAFAGSWEVDFGAQPTDARAIIEAQLEPLGLAVSPSIYTATSGRRVKLPARRGTRLELIEEVGRQVGWKPVYAGRQLKFERGARKEPVAFAGPFMLQIVQVSPSSVFGTAKLSLRVTGVGIPEPLRRQWEQASLHLTDFSARTPGGAELYDAGAETSYRLKSARGGPLVFEQEVGLRGVYRRVDRLAVFRATLKPPGLKPPHDRLRFVVRDLPLKPGPDTPEKARPLLFEGAAPVSAKVLSTLPGFPFYRARVLVRNGADRPLRAVTLKLIYFDAAGHPLGTASCTRKGGALLPGPRERRVLEQVPLRNRPEETTRVGVEVEEARFIDGTEWKRASGGKTR